MGTLGTLFDELRPLGHLASPRWQGLSSFRRVFYQPLTLGDGSNTRFSDGRRFHEVSQYFCVATWSSAVRHSLVLVCISEVYSILNFIQHCIARTLGHWEVCDFQKFWCRHSWYKPTGVTGTATLWVLPASMKGCSRQSSGELDGKILEGL